MNTPSLTRTWGLALLSALALAACDKASLGGSPVPALAHEVVAPAVPDSLPGGNSGSGLGGSSGLGLTGSFPPREAGADPAASVARNR